METGLVRSSVNRDHRNPPDIGDEEFDEWAEGRLSDVEYDTELGKEMGKDAIRLARGEMSEAAFHEKYHEQVKTEFGVDERPTKPEE